MDFDLKLRLLSMWMSIWADNAALRQRTYYRIITDVPIPFPRNYECLKNDSWMEVTNKRWHEGNGWGKPDREIGDIECFYLIKDQSDFTIPASFEAFIKTNATIMETLTERQERLLCKFLDLSNEARILSAEILNKQTRLDVLNKEISRIANDMHAVSSLKKDALHEV